MPVDLRIDSHVEAPPEELFDLMADPATEEDWNPDALEVHRVGDGPIGPGARWHGRYRGMGTMDIELREYNRPTHLAFSIAGSRMDMLFAFTFTPEGDSATKLTADAEIEPKGAMRLMAPLVGPMMRRTFSRRPAQLAAGVAARRAAQRG